MSVAAMANFAWTRLQQDRGSCKLGSPCFGENAKEIMKIWWMSKVAHSMSIVAMATLSGPYLQRGQDSCGNFGSPCFWPEREGKDDDLVGAGVAHSMSIAVTATFAGPCL